MFNVSLNITAQAALEISEKKEKDMELEKLHHILRAYCSRFWETVKVRQADYKIIDVRNELVKAGVPFKDNVQNTYDCDLTWANEEGWFSKVVKQRNDDMKIIISSVTAHIESEAKNSHRNCTWSPDGNHQDDYNWKWLLQLLQKNGFGACINQEGDIDIEW